MIYQKKFLIYLTVILIGSQIIDKASGFGVVIFRNNTFDDPSFAKIENFSSCTQYSTLVKITDTNNQTAEIYLYNKPDIIEAKTGSQSDYNQTLIEIRRAKATYPQLNNSLDSFEKTVTVAFASDEAARSSSKVQQTANREAHIPSNAASITYLSGDTKYTSFLWTNDGKVNLDGILVDSDEYKNVVIKALDASGITIKHSDGSGIIKWKIIPKELQLALGHDPNAPEPKNTPQLISNDFNSTKTSAASLYIISPTEVVIEARTIVKLLQGKQYPIFGLKPDNTRPLNQDQCIIDTGFGMASTPGWNQKISVNENSEKSTETVSLTDVTRINRVNRYSQNPVSSVYECNVITAPTDAYLIFITFVDGTPYGAPYVTEVVSGTHLTAATDIASTASDSEITQKSYFLLGGKLLNVEVH